jgi:hypothetical protein
LVENVRHVRRIPPYENIGEQTMILGMSLSTFTTVHVIISLVGIVSGILVVLGMLSGSKSNGLIALFLASTILTSVTGYFFPADKVLPSHIVGAISLLVLALAVVAFYGKHLAGSWRWIYVVTAVIALWFNCFVGVVQAFQKVSLLQPLAPTQSEPPFQIAQAALLLIMIVAGVVAVRRWRPA